MCAYIPLSGEVSEQKIPRLISTAEIWFYWLNTLRHGLYPVQNPSPPPPPPKDKTIFDLSNVVFIPEGAKNITTNKIWHL